jgi:hypothetical protein
MKYVHGFMDWVHAAGSWVHKPSLNEGRPSDDLRSRSKRPKGYFPDLIVVVGARVDSSQRLIEWWRHGAAGAAKAHRSSALHGYGALFLMFFLPTEPWRHGDLTYAILS